MAFGQVGLGTSQRAARLTRLLSRTLYLSAILCPSRAPQPFTSKLLVRRHGCQFPQSPVRELGMATELLEIFAQRKCNFLTIEIIWNQPDELPLFGLWFTNRRHRRSVRCGWFSLNHLKLFSAPALFEVSGVLAEEGGSWKNTHNVYKYIYTYYIYIYIYIYTHAQSWNANRLSSLRTLAFLDEDLVLIFRTVSWSHRPHISSVAKTRLSLPLSLKARLVCSEILKSPQSAWETSSGNQTVFCAAGYQKKKT